MIFMKHNCRFFQQSVLSVNPKSDHNIQGY